MSEEREIPAPPPAEAALPGTEGAVLYPMRLPETFKERVKQLAAERRCAPADVILAFALQGERCDRANHDAKVEGQP